MIFIGGGVISVLALVGLPIWRAKHQPGSVHGDFRFDSHKTGELGQARQKESGPSPKRQAAKRLRLGIHKIKPRP